MAFMQPEYTNQAMWTVETTHGSEIVPADLVSADPNEDEFRDYIEGSDPDDFELIEGKYWARLSAPGYMDATDWHGPFDTLDDAKNEIETTWEVDPETGESLKENPNRRDVIQAWAAGKKKKASALRTAEGRLYSYDLLIGETLPDGTRVVYDYTGPNRISQTTTTHVNAAKVVADRVSPAPRESLRGVAFYPPSRNPDQPTKKLKAKLLR